MTARIRYGSEHAVVEAASPTVEGVDIPALACYYLLVCCNVVFFVLGRESCLCMR